MIASGASSSSSGSPPGGFWRRKPTVIAAIAIVGILLHLVLRSGFAIGGPPLLWAISSESIRFLAVLVIATPCPLFLAISIANIGSISLCARRAIIVKSPVVLEQIAACRTAIFDKTGTLTFGEPKLTEQLIASGFTKPEVLTLVASLERYSKAKAWACRHLDRQIVGAMLLGVR